MKNGSCFSPLGWRITSLFCSRATCSLCALTGGRRLRLVVCFCGKYVPFVFNKDDFKWCETLYLWMTLSLLIHFTDVGGSIWTQTWFWSCGECWCEWRHSFALLFASLSLRVVLPFFPSVDPPPPFTTMSWVQLPVPARLLCLSTSGMRAFLRFIAGASGPRGELLHLCPVCWR